MSYTPAGSFDYIFKVLLIGDAGVGKSSILLRFTDDSFEEQMASTIGVDFRVKTVTLGGKTVKLTIWDTAGQERFRTLTSSYYRGCHGVILVYDVNERESFTHLQQWLEELELYSTTQHFVKLLVGNKIDVKDRQVTVEEAETFARRQAMMYIETSAKTREGIRQAFEEVVQKILDSPALIQDVTGGPSQLGGLRGLAPPDEDASSGSCGGYC
ncbi:member ras oncogene family [Chrysochromulina tobinii]|uniref:Member ras oncogene family n=1 Tax=Chrysochromulina tobinii TaxID=1460289 RepID=A0A0M0JB56_9EUKA|nr:member ras oncogene family [Chrysochromulina tobinii]|eukprot:KOO23824.1 member ras oncogene family [Chrysochromulina sp. CCMP291]